jgi:RHS repeat-associated protein
MTEIEHALGATPFADHAYGLDNVGNVTSLDEGTDAWTYAYDRLYRVTGVTGPDGNRTYGYDRVGNRTSKILGGTTSYTYDRADRITAAGTSSITVDAAGNTTARGSDTFAYDQANRLTLATVAGATETYSYDGDGVRFSRQVGAGPLIRYVTDVASFLPVTIADGTRKYVWGQGLAFAVNGSTIEVYHADRLGSVRAITNSSGAVTADYRTDEWGILTAQSGSSTQPFGFTGEPRDATGLTYLRARYYDPTVGRFVSRDILAGFDAAPGTLNRYGYATANPVRFVDPSGLWTLGVCSDVTFDIFGIGVALQGCVAVSSSGQFGLTASGGLGGAGGVAPLSAGAGLVAQVSNADYLEDLGGPFYNVGGSSGFGLGAQGSGFGGLGRCQQPVLGGTFGPTLTTPQAGAYGIGTGTGVLVVGGPSAPSCGTKSQALK